MTRTIQIATGCYSRSGTGRGRGITIQTLTVGPETLQLDERANVDLPDPSFVLWSPDGRLLYTVTETVRSRLLALRVDDDGRAEVAAQLDLDGKHPCHLGYAANPSALIIAHYGSGEIETVRLSPDGLPVESIDLDRHGDAEDRASGLEAHAHEVVRLPGTDLLAVPDLGMDRVYLHRQDAAGHVDHAGEITLRRGSGPRHVAADHEAGAIYISCEHSGELATAHRLPAANAAESHYGARSAEQRWSVRSVVPASGSSDTNLPSHIELSADEETLLIANRGPDTLALFTLAGDRPELVDEIAVGTHPRHFARVDDLVLVAAQTADRIDAVRVRGQRLESAGDPVACPSVSCIAVRPGQR